MKRRHALAALVTSATLPFVGIGAAHATPPVRNEVHVISHVTIDGHAPGRDHGVDVDEQGRGQVTHERLYQLVRQAGDIDDHTFEIQLDRAGARAWVFTFG